MRQMLSVTLAPINSVQVPGGKTVLVPLTAIDSGGGPINFSVSSSNPAVQLSLVSTASMSIKLDVTGTGKDGNPFSGTLILHLFEDLAPKTTARIEQLVSQGYYNGLLFYRVIDGFVAQTGQTNGGLGTGVKIDDEFDASLTYVSPGLLGLARQSDHNDTGDAEFFITAVDGAGTTGPITLAFAPTFLDFRYTIFGQLVSGFDTFEKIMTAKVTNNAFGEASSPVDPVTITSATLIDDTHDAVLRVSAPATFNGSSATITVTATNPTGQTTQQTFYATAVTNTVTDPPFLGPVSNRTTTSPTAANFTLTSTDISGRGVFYKITTPSFGTPTDVTVHIDQATGHVTLTPAAGFSGTINLLAAVRAANAADLQSIYDTQAFTLTVNPSSSTTPTAPTGLAVDASSNGPFDGNGYITTGTPKLSVTAETGAIVQFKLNGTVIATATESTTNPDQYSATIPAGKLAVGANSITAVVVDANGTSPDSTALSLIYAPDYGAGVYVVPGTPGSMQQVSLSWASKNAAYADEFGYFVVNSIDGSVGGRTPGSAGYAQAALSSSTRRLIFSKGQKAGAHRSITLTGGQMIVFYMIQNNTTANFLAKNPSDSIHGNNNPNDPLAFFSIKAANPDHMKHAQIIADRTTGRTEFNWEDLISGRDGDFNDAVITICLAGQSGDPPSTVHAPGTGDKNDTLNGTLGGGHQSHAPGDVGIYFVDNPDGSIGSLHPGDAGYAAAALATGNFQVLFTSGTAAGTSQHINVPAGKYLAFYVISKGTTANFLTANPTNSATRRPVAMFSFAAANAGGRTHFRWYAPEGATTNPGVMRLHIMDRVFGSASDFDDLAVGLAFAASSSSSG